MSYITAEKVSEIFMDCLFRDDEIPENGKPANAVMCSGIIHNVGFHKERLMSHTDEINNLIDHWNSQLSEGVSFLTLCVDETGEQWGEHINMEQLLLLGLATHKLQYMCPREFWMILPGGMPYITLVNQPSA